MDAKKENYRHLADNLIKKFEKRRINACYCETAAEAREKVLSMIPKGSSIGFGGSVTLTECGILEALNTPEYDYIDRYAAATPEEVKEATRRTSVCDYFLMSTNAFTRDGELVNIDGRGNRLSFFLYGPEHVILVAGMNKMAVDVDSAIARVRNMASPPNCVRLGMNTPCATAGMCANCLSDDCICCDIVITRFSREPERLHVVLVGEELGF